MYAFQGFRYRSNRRHLFGLLAVTLLTLAVVAVPTSAQEVVKQGTWTTKGFDVDGTWKIVREGGKYFLELDAAFSTKSAPDLKIFLTPTQVEQLDNRNATRGSVLVAVLKSNRGAQRYEIPAGADVAQFKALALHCEQYSKLWAGAELKN